MTMKKATANGQHSALAIERKGTTTMNRVFICSMLATVLPAVAGFASNNLVRPRPTYQSSSRPQSKLAESLQEGIEFQPRGNDKPCSIPALNRREAIGQAYRTSAAIAASAVFANPAVSNADIQGVVTIPQSTTPTESSSKVDGTSVTVFKTKSGLQYIDLVEGTGSSPNYGNLVGISYKAYIKLPDIKGKPMKLDLYDSERGYLVKHGNGRTVPGLDEGLHTMKIGGKRRIIVPPKLGYTSSGLGPIPVGPVGRWKLNHLLDSMMEVKGGNFIFDVEMKSILVDEADQGYYDDESLSPEDFNTLRQNVESSQNAARAT
mmetsp:Transcript_31054/g.53975  ORF Transcript_31054/g.53975 Transcript_31054/m.53975 type:complete len:319 (-) Transcript_31054:144-1100(-)|eukprot:CAMPEP_0201900396 /NCGR_PEP_ID=MMETSP0902-20130614/52203_1 /ASSEMBLY_ACC=CAM_ASM_000551 /TAXON_ID=420261 /ORGANISM="Thalassiosira antarctica, Strain CCMP982" /LENGTH=318 /DNA_ID=CAMNT_0048434045 /DNA_START=29 /DNA_END=985 /DNA_ORIENTATION=-